MSHTPSVHTNADGSTTVDGAVETLAGNVKVAGAVGINGADPDVILGEGAALRIGDGFGNPRGEIDNTGAPQVLGAPQPFDAPVLVPVAVPGDIPAGDYQFTYVWYDALSQGQTGMSQPASITLTEDSDVTVTIPSLPDWATAADPSWAVYRSADGGTTWALAVQAAPSDGLSVVDDGNTISSGPAPVNTTYAQEDHGPMFVQGWFEATGGVGEYGVFPPGTQPSITGALSAVTDPAAKELLTKIVACLVGKGSASNGTT